MWFAPAPQDLDHQRHIRGRVPPPHEGDRTQAMARHLGIEFVVESLLAAVPMTTHRLAHTTLFGKKGQLDEIAQHHIERQALLVVESAVKVKNDDLGFRTQYGRRYIHRCVSFLQKPYHKKEIAL